MMTDSCFLNVVDDRLGVGTQNALNLIKEIIAFFVCKQKTH